MPARVSIRVRRVLTDQTVVVQGDRITALGPANKVRVPAGATMIDGLGKFLIPGLADMHVHVLNHDSAAMADRLFAYVANGVTIIRDMHSGGRKPRRKVFMRSPMGLRSNAG